MNMPTCSFLVFSANPGLQLMKTTVRAVISMHPLASYPLSKYRDVFPCWYTTTFVVGWWLMLSMGWNHLASATTHALASSMMGVLSLDNEMSARENLGTILIELSFSTIKSHRTSDSSMIERITSKTIIFFPKRGACMARGQSRNPGIPAKLVRFWIWWTNHQQTS